MRFLILLLSIVLAACATPPQKPIPTPQPGQGAIGIEVGIRPPLPLQTYTAGVVYFARVDEQGEPDLGKLYVSSHTTGTRTYLLNVPPGRYVAVASAFKVFGDTYISYFPQVMIVQTATEVVERRMAFAGRFLLDSSIGPCRDKADPLQMRISEVIAPGVPKCGLLKTAIHNTLSGPSVVLGGSAFPLGPISVHYAGVLNAADRSDGAKQAFAAAAEIDLRDTGWVVSVN